MNNKKNIDRLFQEKFKDFEVAPNDAVWDRISADLPNKKKKRRVIALWWQIGGVAAILALLLTVGISVFNSGTESKQDLPIVNTEENGGGENTTEDSSTNHTIISPNAQQNNLNTIENNTTKVAESESNNVNTNEKKNNSSKKVNITNQLTTPNKSQLKANNAVVDNANEKEKAKYPSQKRNKIKTITNKNNNTKVTANTKSNNTTSKKSDDATITTKSEMKSMIKKTIKNNNTTVVDNASSKKPNTETLNNSEVKNTDVTDNTEIEDPKKQSLKEALAENTDPINEKEEDEQNRWSIVPNVAPVYFSSFGGKGSTIHSQFNENAKGSDINMSYGLTGSYAISKKLKVRAGVNRVNLNYITSDVYAFTGADALARGESAQMTNVDFKNGVQSISFISAEALNRASSPEVFNTKIAGNIDQRFGFIEIPVELEYKLLDKKFGVNVIGGFSTFFLNNNEIYADLEGVSTLIGEANNINSTSFSANFGLGLDYSLSKQWNINLEPTLKYQLNTFNNTSGNFKPFFIGVYTGLKFKF